MCLNVEMCLQQRLQRLLVLKRNKRPLHPFPLQLPLEPLQLPLISNGQPLPQTTVAVLPKNGTVFNSNGTVFT